MQAAFQHPTHPSVPHDPSLHVNPTTTWQQSIGSILGFPSLHQYGPRALYNSLRAWIAPQRQAFPYGASANEMQGIIRNTIRIGFPFGDAPIFSLMDEYSKGTINMADANLLEELLNWRRASQKDVISLLNAWKKEGIFSRDIPHCGVNLTGISEAAAHNRKILTHYFPELRSMREFKHPLQLYDFNAPINWLSNILGIYVGMGGDLALSRLLDVTARHLGMPINMNPYPGNPTFQSIATGEVGTPNTATIIDGFLPAYPSITAIEPTILELVRTEVPATRY
jgi:hypothetical protein